MGNQMLFLSDSTLWARFWGGVFFWLHRVLFSLNTNIVRAVVVVSRLGELFIYLALYPKAQATTIS